MKHFLKIGFLAVVLIFSGKLVAQENIQVNGDQLHLNDDLLRFYDTELFQWNYGMFGGLSLNYQNKNSNTMFGINESMKVALEQYADTNRLYRLYRGKTIGGNILLYSGCATVVGGAFTTSFADRQDNNNLKIGLSVMAGGIIMEIIGGLILNSGQENIFDAISLFNRQKIKEYK